MWQSSKKEIKKCARIESGNIGASAVHVRGASLHDVKNMRTFFSDFEFAPLAEPVKMFPVKMFPGERWDHTLSVLLMY
jgi:hypothetical protein